VLLGGGECGKTTLFKQIQILHGTGFEESTKQGWVDAIQGCVRRAVKQICAGIENSSTYSLSEENKERASKFSGPGTYDAACAVDVMAIMADPGVKDFLKDPETSLDLDDNAHFFLAKADKIGEPSYLPTDEDILKVRDPTRTIETLDFKFNKAHFRVIDVGGQRMERPKWNLTGEITAVIFVCALTEYNQVLREDIKQNRLKESLNLFDIACNRRYPDKPIILFLNKVDLFVEKIKEVDLKVCFPTYKGGCNYDEALEYIRFRFRNVRKDKARELEIHETTATDSKNAKVVFDAVFDIVEKQNLNDSGF
jgi:GTPase SAR1 family protein